MPALGCLVLCEALLFFTLPKGFALGGLRLDLLYEVVLLAGAAAVGAWGALGATERRVLLGAFGSLALLAPAYDPRAPLERLPAYLAAATLFVLYVEFGLLNAKVARLAALPRAHVTQAGQQREVELNATASRIAQSWPAPLGTALGLLLLCLGLQFALASVAPAALGTSVELRGSFGLALAAVVVLGALAAYVALRVLPRERARAPAPAEPPAQDEARPS